MKKILSYLSLGMVLLTQTLWGNDPLFISLGSDCYTAINLQKAGFREVAFPFDWLISPFNALYKALDEDFKNFLRTIKLPKKGNGVIDTYGFRFIHDWPPVNDVGLEKPDYEGFYFLNEEEIADTRKKNIENADHIDIPRDEHYAKSLSHFFKYLSNVQQKYKRRCERFQNICFGDRKIYFIRGGDTTKEQAILLRDLVRRKYPNLDFFLLVVGDDESFKERWDLEGIKNFYSETFSSGAHFLDWGDFFREIASK